MPSFRLASATETTLQEPPPWVWLAFPPVLIIVQYTIRYYDSATYSLLFESEVGIVELATPAVLLVAIGAGGAALRYRGRFPGVWLNLWVPLIALACFYFAGEELSWGQHLFGWATPEYLNRINDQGETNIHNISSW
ncbi:MAG: hypothetical protein ACREV1_03740, partial [Gammaproteobacteria bacterium]